MKKAKKFTALLMTMAMLNGLGGISVSADETAAMPSNVTDYVALTELPANLVKNSASYNAYSNTGAFNAGYYTLAARDFTYTQNVISFMRDASGTKNTRDPFGTVILTPSNANYNASEYAISEDFASGQKYVVSAKVRLTQDLNAEGNNKTYTETKSTSESVPFGIGIIRDGNPAASSALVCQNVTSAEWKDMKGVITAPEIDEDQKHAYVLALGLMNDFETDGGGVTLSTKSGESLYLAKETAHDISLTADSETLVSGINHTITAKASLLNQLGLEMKDSSTFNWYALNADKTAAVNDIVITPSADTKTATVNAAENASAGSYTILVESVDKGWVKSIPVAVKAVPADYVAGERASAIHSGSLGGNGTTSAGKDVTLTHDGYTATLKKTGTSVTEAGNFMFHGQNIKLKDGEKLLKDKAYVVEIYAKNAAPDVAETVQFGIMADYSAYGINKVWDVSNTEYQKYTAVLKPTARDTSELSVGIPYTYGTVGAKVSFEYRSEVTKYPLYVAPEEKYDISVSADGSAIIAGVSSITANANILNQIGTEYTGEQGTFTWLAMNADKTALTKEITITPSADGKTATISADKNAVAGTYKAVAINDTTGYAKTLGISVISAEDTPDTEKNDNLIIEPTSVYAYCGVGANDGKYTYSHSMMEPTRIEFKRNAAADVPTRNPFGNVVKYEPDNTSSKSLKETLKPNTNYVVSAYLRLSDETQSGVLYSSTPHPTVYESGSTADSVKFGMGIVRDGNPAADCLATWDITGKEYKEYKAVIKSPKTFIENTTYPEKTAYPYMLDIGLMNDFATDGGAVVMDVSRGIYFAEEAAYGISNKVTGKDCIIPGGSTTLNAEILNQIGLEYTANQNITWYAMNENCTAAADEITITENGNGNVTVKASDNAAYGKYTIIAASEDYGMTKKAVISVVDSVDERISSLKFTRLGEEVILNAEVKDTNKSSINFALGEFNGNKLVKIDVKAVAVENGKASAQLSISGAAADNKLKAFVLDDNMAPIANIYKYATETTVGSLDSLYGSEQVITMFDAPQVCEFYNNKDAAVSITFDDGILSAAQYYDGYL